jgi:2,3-dihydroxyphenylpropionate 1,2-dioxygenase
VSAFAAVCAAHAPLALHSATVAPQKDEYLSSLKKCGDWVRDFSPDLVVEFAPDHFNGFFYNVMPNFCIGTGATSVGDWATNTGPLNVPSDIAMEALKFARKSDVDCDLSYSMQVDHGFTQILELMFGSIDAYPVIPIMINCAAPPRPAFRRVRLLGEVIGRYFRQTDLRVLFLGSGGLSHDPPMVNIEDASEAQRRMLIGDKPWSTDARKARENRVVSAAIDFATGKETGSRHPNPQWDCDFMDLMKSGNIAAADGWTDETLTEVAGCGGHEVRTWVASFAAMQAATGTYAMDVDYYEIVTAWMTGMGVVRACG